MPLSIQTDKIQTTYKESNLARAVFDTLATRERPRDITDLTRLRLEVMKEQGLSIDVREFITFFKAMEKCKLGVLLSPRSKTDHWRFKWSCNHIELARTAKGMKPVPKPAMTSAVPEGVVVTHYPLRDTMVALPLPKDMTKKEAEELAEFIKRFGR